MGRIGEPAMTSPAPPLREIPFNYTSADDRQAVHLLLGPDAWEKLEALRARRVTGRSARLLSRFFGEMLVHQRNPFLLQELLDSPPRRQRFLANAAKDGCPVSQALKGNVELAVDAALA